MSAIRGIPTVFRFEWKRSLTVPRLVWWVVLTAFAPALLGLIRINEGPPPGDATDVSAVIVYALCPSVVCMLGVFLWATPAIASELEGRSWVYLAVRPRGAQSVLLGKYLVAVTWALPAGLIAATLSLLVLAPESFGKVLWVQLALVALSCPAYAALFILIGVVFHKRAMAVGVLYALICEVALAMVPAVVNKITIQFRLRCLLVRWMDWSKSEAGNSAAFQAYFGDESALWHLGILAAMVVGMLGTAAFILHCREFTSSAETDV